jgi:cell division transport system permease protein
LSAILAIWAVTGQMAGLGSELLTGGVLTRGDWLLLALLPLIFALVATVAARIAVLGRLRQVQ